MEIPYLRRYNPISSHNDMVLGRNVKKGVHLEEEYVGGCIILKGISKFQREEVKSIGLFQNGDNLSFFVNPVMNILLP